MELQLAINEIDNQIEYWSAVAVKANGFDFFEALGCIKALRQLRNKLSAAPSPAPQAAPSPRGELVMCDRCKGRGSFICTLCHGDGDIEHNNGSVTQCPQCEGEGRIDCMQCKGTGRMEVEREAEPQPPIVQLMEAIGARVVSMPTVADMRKPAPPSTGTGTAKRVKLTKAQREALDLLGNGKTIGRSKDNVSFSVRDRDDFRSFQSSTTDALIEQGLIVEVPGKSDDFWAYRVLQLTEQGRAALTER